MTDDDLEASLADALAPDDWGPDPGDWEPVPDGVELREEEKRERAWEVDGPRTASWAVRKVGQARARLAEVEELYAEQKARLDDWRESAMRADRRRVAFFENRLEQWFRSIRAEDPQVHSRPLPGGKVAHTSSQKLRISDEDAFVAWATEHAPELVKTVPIGIAPVKALLGKTKDKVPKLRPVLNETGEKIPGIEIDENDNYRVETE